MNKYWCTNWEFLIWWELIKQDITFDQLGILFDCLNENAYKERNIRALVQLSLSLSWLLALWRPSRTASASMSVISRSYPKNVLLSSSSLIRRRTSVPRVYNARRCLKRSTVDTPLGTVSPCVTVCWYCYLFLVQTAGNFPPKSM